ncbi:MAG: phage portal protein [Muribaculum sp.]|nr:phage portal protein [Muribaculum sp.]MCM1577045.1 phage portal protein [Bacteroides sp.]
MKQPAVIEEPVNTIFTTRPTDLKAMLIRLLSSNKVDEAMKMFVTHRKEALKAIDEYRSDRHKIQYRLDKQRIGKDPYEVCKLPRNWQEQINETAVFFFLGNPLLFMLGNDKSEIQELKPYFQLFTDFLADVYFDERTRTAKRIAGAETECAKLYNYFVDESGEIKVRCQVLANSDNRTLYTLFDRFDNMVAFAVGYYMRDLEFNTQEHWDVYTNKQIFNCRKDITGWNVEERENPIGKIPVIYYHQDKEWKGVQERIERDEWTSSKRGDTNDYTGDPYLVMTPDIADKRLADGKEVGKAVIVSDEKSVFKFIAPPDASTSVENEKEEMRTSILDGTNTPDLSYKSIMGLGTLSGEAMRRMALPGYMKRSNRAEIYNELFNREIHLIISILCNIIYIDNEDICNGLRRLKIKFSYQDPFIGGLEDNSTEIATLVGCGAMSIRSAVEMNRNVQDKELEMDRIWEEKEREMRLQAQITKEMSNDLDNG